MNTAHSLSAVTDGRLFHKLCYRVANEIGGQVMAWETPYSASAYRATVYAYETNELLYFYLHPTDGTMAIAKKYEHERRFINRSELATFFPSFHVLTSEEAHRSPFFTDLLS